MRTRGREEARTRERNLPREAWLPQPRTCVYNLTLGDKSVDSTGDIVTVKYTWYGLACTAE